MKSEYFLLMLIIVANVVRVIPWVGTGLWWDEVVYIGLSHSIMQGFYSLDPSLPIESFRPPLLPLILSPMQSIFIMKAAVFIISILSVYAVYKFSSLFGKKPALLSALFLSTSYLFIFFSSKILTEPLFIAAISASLFFYYQYLEKQKLSPLLCAGIFAALAFLSRYLATMLILAYVLLLISQKKLKPFLAFILPLALILLPWSVLSLHYYGSPWESYALNFSVYAVSIPQSFQQGVLDILGVLGILTVFIAVFFWKGEKSKTTPLILLFIFTIVVYLAAPHKEPRYLLSFLPIYTVLAALGAKKLISLSKGALPLVIALSLIPLAFGLQNAIEDSKSSSLVEASLYLKQISSPGDLILTQSYPFVYVLSERKAVPYCDFVDQKSFNACQEKTLKGEFPLENLEEVLSKYPIRYVLSSSSEPANIPSARILIEKRFKKIRTFSGTSEVVIYGI